MRRVSSRDEEEAGTLWFWSTKLQKKTNQKLPSVKLKAEEKEEDSPVLQKGQSVGVHVTWRFFPGGLKAVDT